MPERRLTQQAALVGEEPHNLGELGLVVAEYLAQPATRGADQGFLDHPFQRRRLRDLAGCAGRIEPLHELRPLGGDDK